MTRRNSGYSLIEVVITMAIFGVFLLILTTMTAEMKGQDKRYPVNFMRHPQVIALLSRMRKDVVDAHGADPYPPAFDTYVQSPKTLIVYSIQQSGFAQTIVWDFTTRGEARRKAFNAGKLTSDWVARGMPDFVVSTFEIPGRPYSVRLLARDKDGELAIDQIYQPRAHE